MTPEEEEVRAAALRFYDAIEQIISGKGVDAMVAAWHHTPKVTSGHPMGDWAYGWDEVLATWTVFSTIGKPENVGSKVRDLRVHLYGDTAYTTCIFTTAPSFGGVDLACTNVLHRANGQWKIVHHHADKTRAVEQTMERIANES